MFYQEENILESELDFMNGYSPNMSTKSILKASNLSKSFGSQIVLEDVMVELHEGEVVLLRGDNGSGKTTLLNILTGNLEPDMGTIWLKADGSVENFHFPLRWWQNIDPFRHFTPEKVANEAVGRTWQDIRLFESRSVLENIAVATRNQPGENPINILFRNRLASRFEKKNKNECVKLLAKFGLETLKNSLGNKLSLGQTKRVAIARAVQAGARILFLDEPLSGLDAEGIEDIIDVLKELVEKEKVTLVIVEHVFNIPLILRFANTIWTLNNGRMQIESARNVSKLISTNNFYSGVANLINQFVEAGKQIHEQLFYDGVRLLRISDHALQQNMVTPVLDVQSLVVYRDERLVVGQKLENGSIQGLSFKLYQSDIAILYAPNGWGKTTLLQTLTGIIPMFGGEVIFRKTHLNKIPTWNRAKLGMHLITARDNMFPNLTVDEFLTLSHQQVIRKSSSQKSKKMIGELSGGERQKVALKNISEPNSLILLDEPFLGLDEEAISETEKQLSYFINDLKGTLLIVLPSTVNCSEQLLN